MKFPFNKSLSLLFFLLLSTSLFAQDLILKKSIPIIENGDTLTSPFAGGLNQPQFSAIELNGDTLMDLIVFDRSGDKILPFVNHGGPGQMDYRYAPEWESVFPEIYHWMQLRDYNCDGKMDIFCYGKTVSSIAVYRNERDANGMKFSLVVGTLIDSLTEDPIPVLSRDLPGIDDIDGDGDMDILAFDFGGLYVEWFQNLSVEKGYGCDSLHFQKASTCWGEFMENGLNNTVTLDVSCKGQSAGKTNEHSGSTIALFDYEGDGVKEIVLGDIGAGNLVFLHNGGTGSQAKMDTFLYLFPALSPVNMDIFPAAFFIDLDLDGKDEMLVAPNAPNISINFQNVWLYENVGVGDTNVFDFRTKNFLSRQMMECGMASHPVFYDYNGDGLMDLLIGNQHYKSNASNEAAALTVYRNTGTAHAPAFTLESRDYLNLSGFFNPPEIGLAPAFGDMDADGDQDMILGTSTGKMHYFENNAQNDSSVFSLTIFDLFSLDVGQGAVPEIYDLDEDGQLDLIVGEYAGNMNFFKNTGTAQNMRFAMPADKSDLGGINLGGGFSGYSVGRILENTIPKPELFVGGEAGTLLRYYDIQGRIYKDYFLADSAYGALDVGERLSFDAADIDGDGKFEFVIGNLRGGIGIYDGNITTDIEEVTASPRHDIAIRQRDGWLEVRFQGEAFREGALSLWDMQGREVERLKMTHFQPVVALRAPAVGGVYILRMEIDGQFIGTKLVVK